MLQLLLPEFQQKGRPCDHLTLRSRSRISWYVMFARYPRSLNSARRDARAPAVSSLDRVYRPVSLSLSRRATIIGNYKDSIPSHKGSKTLLFFYLFLLFFARGWLVVKWAASSNPITGFTSFTREFIMAAINRQWDKRDFFHGSYNRFDEGKDDEADRRESGRSFRLFQSSSCATRFLFFFSIGEKKEIPEDGTPRRRVAH